MLRPCLSRVCCFVIWTILVTSLSTLSCWRLWTCLLNRSTSSMIRSLEVLISLRASPLAADKLLSSSGTFFQERSAFSRLVSSFSKVIASFLPKISTSSLLLLWCLSAVFQGVIVLAWPLKGLTWTPVCILFLTTNQCTGVIGLFFAERALSSLRIILCIMQMGQTGS